MVGSRSMLAANGLWFVAVGVTNRENTIHQYTTKRSLPTGVSKRGNRYIAQTTIKGKKKHIGSFQSIIEAKSAYDNYNPTATNPC